MFTVVANGSNLTYQWQRNGEGLTDGDKYSGARTAALTVMNVTQDDEGNFTCVVTDDVDNVTSNAAELTVRKCMCVCVHSLVFAASFLGLLGLHEYSNLWSLHTCLNVMLYIQIIA